MERLVAVKEEAVLVSEQLWLRLTAAGLFWDAWDVDGWGTGEVGGAGTRNWPFGRFVLILSSSGNKKNLQSS